MATSEGNGRRAVPGAAEIRRAMCGTGDGLLVVLQQAYRLTPEHSDELVVLGAGRDHWVAARLGDRTVVWACHDRFSADDMFDGIIAGEPGWKRAGTQPRVA